MTERTKALDISSKVKKIVYERDKQRCILCHSVYGQPNAHYIARSHGGLGVEENIVTLCLQCHHRYDNTIERELLKPIIREYLILQYQNWNEDKLIYRKWSDLSGN